MSQGRRQRQQRQQAHQRPDYAQNPVAFYVNALPRPDPEVGEGTLPRDPLGAYACATGPERSRIMDMMAAGYSLDSARHVVQAMRDALAQGNLKGLTVIMTPPTEPLHVQVSAVAVPFAPPPGPPPAQQPTAPRRGQAAGTRKRSRRERRRRT